MTGQISDSIIYKRKEYSLAEFEGGHLFDPAKYGIQPQPTSSANWRGFVCTYKVYRKRLKLSNLSINIEDHEYKKLFKALNIDSDPNVSHYHYIDYLDNLLIDVDFTGKILIGKDFIHGFYIHMGFQSAFSYQNVWSLEFDHGLLGKAEDLSPEMEDLRNSYIENIKGNKEPLNLFEWIEERFSQRIRRKQK
jgi:hypothetical protein